MCDQSLSLSFYISILPRPNEDGLQLKEDQPVSLTFKSMAMCQTCASFTGTWPGAFCPDPEKEKSMIRRWHLESDRGLSDSFIRLFIHSFIHLSIFVHLFVLSFVHLFIPSSVHLFIPSSVHLFIRSFFDSFICSFILSVVGWPVLRLIIESPKRHLSSLTNGNEHLSSNIGNFCLCSFHLLKKIRRYPSWDQPEVHGKFSSERWLGGQMDDQWMTSGILKTLIHGIRLPINNWSWGRL